MIVLCWSYCQSACQPLIFSTSCSHHSLVCSWETWTYCAIWIFNVEMIIIWMLTDLHIIHNWSIRPDRSREVITSGYLNNYTSTITPGLNMQHVRYVIIIHGVTYISSIQHYAHFISPWFQPSSYFNAWSVPKTIGCNEIQHNHRLGMGREGRTFEPIAHLFSVQLTLGGSWQAFVVLKKINLQSEKCHWNPWQKHGSLGKVQGTEGTK